DSVAKGRRFKTLKRQYCRTDQGPRVTDSLFVIWAFDSPSPATLKMNLLAALAGVPRPEQPDLVVVPDQLVARAGTYLELSVMGQPNSPHRIRLHEEHGPALDHLIPDAASVYAL